jgi:protein cornichon
MTWAWLPPVVAVLIVGVILLFIVVVLVTLTDLASDHINPIEASRRLNSFVFPEYAAHLVLLIWFLVTGQLFEVALNVPLAGWHAWHAVQQTWRVDPTEIFRVREHMRNVYFAKFVFLFLQIFLCIGRFIYSIVYGGAGAHFAQAIHPVANIISRVVA